MNLLKLRQKAHRLIVRIFPSQKSLWSFFPSWQTGTAQSKPKNYRNYAKEGYEQVVWVYRCCCEIAEAVSSVPWKLFLIRKDGKSEEIQNHEILEIMKHPNPIMSWKDFIEAWSIYLNVSGNCYIELIEMRRNGRPKGLFPLRPDRINIIPDAVNYIQSYKYTINGKIIKIPANEIIHYKYFNPTNDFYGLSPIQVGANIIDTENFAETWNRKSLENDAVPGGAFVVEDDLTDTQRANLKSEINNAMQGYNHARRPLLLEGGTKWVTMALTARDMDFINLRKMDRETLCGLFGVPPVVVGILDKSTYNNYQSALKSFWEETVISHLNKFRDKLNHELIPRWGDNIKIDYDLSNVPALQESRDNQSKRLTAYVNRGIITINEARQEMGLDEVAWGDTWYAPMNLLPVGSAKPEEEKPEKETEKAYKSFKTKISKRERVKEFLKRLDKWKEKLTPEIKKLFNGDLKDIQKELKRYYLGSKEAETLKNIDKKTKKRWDKAVSLIVKTIVKDSGESRLKSKGKFLHKDFEDWFKVANEWIDKYTAMQVTEINGTTHSFVETFIKDTMKDKIEEGATFREIADVFQGEWKDMSDRRALLIASTESQGAMNSGHFYSGIALEYEEKEWSNSGDIDRVRTWHQISQVRKYKKPFEVEGEQLMFPGDSNLGASGKNVIACRCTILEY